MEKIGEGRSAEVYNQGDFVLKVFKSTNAVNTCKHEFNCHKIAYEQGAMVPKVYELINYNGRSAIVCEKIIGSSLKTLLEEDFIKYKNTFSEYADALHTIHKIKPENIQNLRFEVAINEIASLEESLKKNIIDTIQHYPKGDKLIHGDLHPDNILVADTFFIIDWEGARRGHPCEDLARVAILLDSPLGIKGVPKVMKPIARFMMSSYRRKLLNSYLKTSEYSMKDVKMWMLPMLAIRLGENIPYEKKWLLRKIKKSLRAVNKYFL